MKRTRQESEPDTILIRPALSSVNVYVPIIYDTYRHHMHSFFTLLSILCTVPRALRVLKILLSIKCCFIVIRTHTCSEHERIKTMSLSTQRVIVPAAGKRIANLVVSAPWCSFTLYKADGLRQRRPLTAAHHFVDYALDGRGRFVEGFALMACVCSRSVSFCCATEIRRRGRAWRKGQHRSGPLKFPVKV